MDASPASCGILGNTSADLSYGVSQDLLRDLNRGFLCSFSSDLSWDPRWPSVLSCERLKDLSRFNPCIGLSEMSLSQGDCGREFDKEFCEM